MLRTFVATITYDEDVAARFCETNGISTDTAPGDFLEKSFRDLEYTGLNLVDWALMDDDEQWERYLQYVANWVIDHNSPEYAGCSPTLFNEWVDCGEM